MITEKVRVFDNGGKTFDRFTVFIPISNADFEIYTMSENPLAHDGFNNFCCTGPLILESEGKEIDLKDLSLEMLRAIKYRLKS